MHMIVKGKLNDGGVWQTPAHQFYSLAGQGIHAISVLTDLSILLRQNPLASTPLSGNALAFNVQKPAAL
ncbi:hypothetical protein QF001_000472 [Paraburkholderia youngii]